MKLTAKDVMHAVNEWYTLYGVWPEQVTTTPTVLASLNEGEKRYMRGPYTIRGNVRVVADRKCPPNTFYIVRAS